MIPLLILTMFGRTDGSPVNNIPVGTLFGKQIISYISLFDIISLRYAYIYKLNHFYKSKPATTTDNYKN